MRIDALGGKQDPLNLISSRFDRTNFDLNGGFIGGTAGAQIQQGNVVLGIESDIDWANIKGSGVVVPAIAGVPAGITLNLTRVNQGYDRALMSPNPSSGRTGLPLQLSRDVKHVAAWRGVGRSQKRLGHFRSVSFGSVPLVPGAAGSNHVCL